MKKLRILIYLLIISSTIHAQLNTIHNSLRSGDIIIKQQVEFKNPGEAKAHEFWDFSQVKLINEEYELEYSEAPLIGDSVYVMGYNQFPKQARQHLEFIIGKEHNTMYYFKQTKDSLLLLGHENVAVVLENKQPILNLKFPLNYGGLPILSKYTTKGLYSGTTEIESEGNISISADAFGTMVLPSGDTINPVLRVKIQQTIKDLSNASQLDNIGGQIFESYRWYSKGYRYPIFETVQNREITTDSILFSTAFYFPPQDHLYLDTDPENLALLDKLWDYTKDDTDIFKKVDLFEDKQYKYNIYPNPVLDILNIEYVLDLEVPVNIIMATIDGKVVKNIYRNRQTIGKQFEQVDCSNLMVGVYLLKVVAGDLVINERIIKK